MVEEHHLLLKIVPRHPRKKAMAPLGRCLCLHCCSRLGHVPSRQSGWRRGRWCDRLLHWLSRARCHIHWRWILRTPCSLPQLLRNPRFLAAAQRRSWWCRWCRWRCCSWRRRWRGGLWRGCEPGAGETLAVGEENSLETAGRCHAEQSPAWKKVDGPP